MPPDLPNEQELNLKKRARRRLVGAIALVLLMVIVLPQVLQDRAATTQHNAIKITMPEPPPPASRESEVSDEGATQARELVDAGETEVVVDDSIAPEGASNKDAAIEDFIASKEADSKKNEPKKTEPKKTETVTSATKLESNEKTKLTEAKTLDNKKVEIKPAPSKVAEIKTTEIKTEPKPSEHFTVQVGVYSDLANVKRLQDQLKQAGFSTTTEKVSTPKGESIRLKAGTFKSRQDAVNALDKLKSIGVPGIVIGHD